MTRPLALIAAVALVVAAFIIAFALVSYGAIQIAGASPAGSNLLGLGGAYLAHGLIIVWGLGAAVLPLVAIQWALVLWKEDSLPDLGQRLVGLALLIPAVCGLLHLLPSGAWSERLLIAWDQAQLGGLGGAVGYQLCGPPSPVGMPAWPGGVLWRHLGTGGSTLVLVAVVLTGVLLLDLGIGRSLRRAWRELRGLGTGKPQRISTAPFIPKNEIERKRRQTTSIQAIAQRIEKIERKQVPVPDDVEALVQRIRGHLRDPSVPANETPLFPPEPVAAGPVAAGTVADEPAAVAPVAAPVSVSAPGPAPVTSEPAPVVAAAAPKPKPKPKAAAAAAGDEYTLPPVSLLDVRPERKDALHEQEKQQTAKAIEDVFASFEISVQVVGATRGPVVTQYELRLLDQKMRVNKVEGFEKDLAMRLGTEGIRIVAPLPNKTTVGVEVPNKIKEPVVMRDLVEESDLAAMALPIILGRDAIGRPMVADLAKAPHLLVAGATGMGKSVCMNAMICSILLFRSPDDVKFIMVDPKMVELAGYEDIPHLLTPPITDMTKAHAALDWACQTMDGRYELLKATGVRQISDFNALGEDEVRFRLAKRSLKLEDMAHDQAKMPYIVVLVDEYADLMMVNKEVEKSIVRLAAKSRAAGIHVILTTQRPSADVVTGLIKSNLPCRLCFRVVDKSNSRVVLDVSGAENLLGKGDMLFLAPGTSFPIRGQGVWLKDKEIESIVEHAKAQGSPTYNDEVLKVGAVASEGGGGAGDGKSGDAWITDKQFHEAVQCMYRYQRTGADFFRRKMNIGYNRATSFVEWLEDLGFIGPIKPGGAREITKSWDDWIDLLKANSVTWTDDDEIYHNPSVLG